jgi:acyl-CoA thioesterase-2
VPDETVRAATSAIVTDALTLDALTGDAVALDAVAPESADLAFEGRTGPVPWPKAYGGDMVAQAAVAAMRSETSGKRLHSMHSYFLRPVDIEQTVHYDVEVLRDGRGYGTRQVRGLQNGKLAFAALASFTHGEDGPATGIPAPAWIDELLTQPEDVPASADVLAGREGGTMTDHSRRYWSGGRGFDMRHIPGPIYLSVEGSREPHQAVWLRPFTPLTPVPGLDDAQRDAAALAYACDYTILEPLLRALGIAWADPGLTTASLDHSMWFHRPVSFDDWLLYTHEAVDVGGGRGLALGRFYTRDLQPIATVMLEGLIRIEPTVPKDPR